MGGRGSSSNLTAHMQKKYHFSIDNLSGSEKQKKWAQNIVDEAFETVNKNVQNNLKHKVTYGTANNFMKAGDIIKKMLSNVSSAKEIIDMRDRISSRAIVSLVNQADIIERNKKHKR